jgi:predicted  nucleic acid-binding Zn-ribbon protein
VTSDFLYMLVAFLVVLFLWALYELYQCLVDASRLVDGVAKLADVALTDDPFPGQSSLQQRAAAIARKAQHPALLAQLDPERELGPIKAEFSARLGRPRALSGLLIIIGLLITLTNLRNAVDAMKGALEPSQTNGSLVAPKSPSSAPGTTAPESKVQQGIAEIARAAGLAFGYSTGAIGLAASVLFLSIATQRRTSWAVGTFSAWLFARHDEALLKQVEQPQDTAAKLAYAAESLARVAATFEETNAALGELKLFGGKLDSAAREISSAVASLPTQIDTSMAKISGDVAQGIRTGLENQLEYLKSLVAIYSDHALVLQKIVDFISRITEANKSASEALVQLRSLPDDISAVAASAANAKTATRELTTIMQDLDRKVQALPGVELGNAASQLSDAAARLISLENDIGTMRETAKSFLQSTIDEAMRRNGELTVQQLERLAAAIQALKADVAGDGVAHSAALQSLLSQLKTAVDKLGPGRDSGEIKALRIQLEQLIQRVGSLPSVKLMRIFGG